MNLDHIKEKLSKEKPGLPKSVIDEIVEEKYRKLKEEEDGQQDSILYCDYLVYCEVYKNRKVVNND